MASKQRADKQKEKEKKEKIILIALVAVLVIVGAIELPKMLKSGGSKGGSTVSAGQTTPTTSGTGTGTGTGTVTGGTPIPGVAGPISTLPDSSGYKAGAGQLSRFSLFKTHDPFGSATPTSGATTSSTTSARTTSTTQQGGQYVAARVSINGASEDVILSASFPAASPVFTLDSVTAQKIEISVAGGSFASGQSKVAIKKGKSVVLVNTVDSTRYAIKFIRALTATQLTLTTIGTTSGGGATTSGTTTTTGGSTTS
jgi:hypothetical protein